MLYEAFMAGTWASIGSTIGKLTGTTSIVGDGYIIWAFLLFLMVLVNMWGCRYYLRSLDAADNSAAPTVISATSSYVISVYKFEMLLVRSYIVASDCILPYFKSPLKCGVAGNNGFIGICFFGELSSPRWWAGALLIVTGLALVARSAPGESKERKKVE